MYQRAMEARRKPRLRFTGFGRTSWPEPSSSARFHSGCLASSAWFSAESLGSRMVRSSTASAAAIMALTTRKRG